MAVVALAVQRAPHLADWTTALRLSVHVLAATIWVGGQLTLAGLLPTLRGAGGETTRRAARAFARLAWPAFFLLVATGVWNVAATHHLDQNKTWERVLSVKIALVVLAGVATLVHQRARRGRSSRPPAPVARSSRSRPSHSASCSLAERKPPATGRRRVG